VTGLGKILFCACSDADAHLCGCLEQIAVLVALFEFLRLIPKAASAPFGRSAFPPRLPAHPPIMPRYHRWMGGEAGWEGGAEKPKGFDTGEKTIPTKQMPASAL